MASRRTSTALGIRISSRKHNKRNPRLDQIRCGGDRPLSKLIGALQVNWL